MKAQTTLLNIALAFLFSAAIAQSPPPAIEWQNTIGGSDEDQLFSIQQTSDNGFILGGCSASGISGDKTEASTGNADYWTVKLDSAGSIEWQNTIGSDSNDFLITIQQTADAGYILGGFSYSGISGDKTETSSGESDYWVVKLNAAGTIEWQNTIGGNSYDFLFTIQQTTDAGYILGGFSYSGISGDKTEASAGANDYWVVKLNSTGSIEWQNTIGGDDYDELQAIKQTADGGYIIGGSSGSGISGDKTEASLGEHDYWVVKLNNTGSIEWQQTIGGSDIDELRTIQQLSDGSYILGGRSSSGISGDKTEASLGGDDYWVVKLNSTGTIEWQNTIGGSNFDELRSIQQTADSGYLLGGRSSSGISGDKTEASLGGEDFWVVKLNSTGAIEWQNTIGGSGDDLLFRVQPLSDGGYILGGCSESNISGDKTEASAGVKDYWVVKLYPECTGLTVYADTDNDGYGDSTNTYFTPDCVPPVGYVLNSSDCNDADSIVHPDAAEVCNSLDDNCNGIADEGLLFQYYYADMDSDGFGNANATTVACLQPTAYVTDSTDCNDADAAINPSAVEICNGIDDNCNGTADDGLPSTTYYADADGDSFGNAADLLNFCQQPEGYVTDSTDCDDTNAAINPSSTEICNAMDDDCNGTTDDGLPTNTYYADADGDSFGDANDLLNFCEQPAGYVFDSTDCDDNNAGVYPGATEITNNAIDDDCDGYIDEFGVGIHEIATTSAFFIAPNPAEGETTISFYLTQSSHVCVKMYDVSGKEMVTLLNGDLKKGDHSLPFNISHFAKGVYMISLLAPEMMLYENQKLIIK